MENLSVIIQARMGSKRLPGKSLKKISNKRIIDWVIKRIKKSRKIRKIILATTKSKKDKIFEKIAKKNKILIFRGKTDDVLDRFYKAAKFYNIDIIIRVCADNPFIHFKQLDLLIKKFSSKKYDYICNHQNKLKSNYADGFGAEIFSFKILKRLSDKAKQKLQREHITKYIWDNKKKFKILSLKAPKKLAYPNFKFDVNTISELNYLNEFAKNNNINLSSSAEDIIRFKLREEKSKGNFF